MKILSPRLSRIEGEHLSFSKGPSNTIRGISLTGLFMLRSDGTTQPIKLYSAEGKVTRDPREAVLVGYMLDGVECGMPLHIFDDQDGIINRETHH